MVRVLFSHHVLCGSQTLFIAPEILGNPATTLMEAEQKMEVCPLFFLVPLFHLVIIIGMDSHTSGTPPLLRAKSACSAVDVRNKFKYWRMELVLHACLLRLMCTCPEFRDFFFYITSLPILLMPFFCFGS